MTAAADDPTDGTDPKYLCPTCGRHKPCRHCPDLAGLLVLDGDQGATTTLNLTELGWALGMDDDEEAT